jgi:hypothetical protein
MQSLIIDQVMLVRLTLLRPPRKMVLQILLLLLTMPGPRLRELVACVCFGESCGDSKMKFNAATRGRQNGDLV